MKKVFLSLVVLSIGVGSAQAWNGCNGGFGYGWGYLFDNLDNKVPHFAAYPPVYYSYPVPRTYGYSPFAYPPGVMTPEVIETVEPSIIENPHVENSIPETQARPEAKNESTVGGPSSSVPLVIVNPYATEPFAAR